MDVMYVQVEGTEEKRSIPYLLYAEDYCEPFDEGRDEKIFNQTVEFAKSLGLREGSYMLCGFEKTIENVQKAISVKNAEQRKLYQKYDQDARI